MNEKETNKRIESNIIQLKDTVDNIDRVVATLCDVLTVVCVPEPAIQGASTCKEGGVPCSPLSSEIATITGHLGNVLRYIENITNRIDL